MRLTADDHDGCIIQLEFAARGFEDIAKKSPRPDTRKLCRQWAKHIRMFLDGSAPVQIMPGVALPDV